MLIRCSHCQNVIYPSEYKGVYRCGYCHIWLKEEEVIKSNFDASTGSSHNDVGSIPLTAPGEGSPVETGGVHPLPRKDDPELLP